LAASFIVPKHDKPSRSNGGPQLNRKGIEYGLKEVEPELWEWQFQIGETVTTGRTRTRLMGMAARRVQLRIDRALMARVPTEMREYKKEVALTSAATAARQLRVASS
jgi:hypothetical protein